MRTLLLGVAVAVFGLIGTAPTAKADFQLRYSLNGGGSYTTISDNQAGPGGDEDLINPDTIKVTLASGLLLEFKASGSFSTAQTSLDLEVTGLVPSATTLDLVVQASVNGIDTAPAPQSLMYNFTGTISNPGTLTSTMRTFIDRNDNLFGEPSADIAADTNNLAVPSSDVISFNADPDYSMTTEVRVIGSTGSLIPAGLNLDNNSVITPGLVAVPAPAGVVLAATGLPMLGLGTWIRRRRARSAG